MPKNLQIDFGSDANNFRRLHGGGRGQAIARAIGIRNYGLPLHVIDATAGLGQDAFVLASLGCTVTMIERCPAVAHLLSDALQRGLDVAAINPIISNMQLLVGDAKDVLPKLTTGQFPDVVYLDPMFPPRNKSALVKQELRLIKDLVGADLDADQLLNIALKVAKKRVVVKRPRLAPHLGLIVPHATQLGKANRFDIYMPATP